MVERTKEARATAMTRKAEEMANSGDYADYLDIEAALSAEGYTEARTHLDRSHFRDRLRRMCDAARARKANKDA